jgi:chromosome partitioning protein
MGTVISVINQKGGTGKTTTAVNLSAGMARKGHRVLLIDLDPQAHATYGLGVDLDEAEKRRPTVGSVLNDERMPLAEIVLDTSEPNLKLAPADIRLAKAAALLHTRTFREAVLAEVLEPVTPQFDYVVIDCMPSLDVLSVNALVAADRAIVPTQLGGHSLLGLQDLLTTMVSIKKRSPDFDWRILLTMVSGHGEERQKTAARILEPLRERILETRIRRTEVIERSQMEGEDEELTPVVLQQKWNRGRRDYRQLVDEVLQLWPV